MDPSSTSWLSEVVSRHGLLVGLPLVFLGGLALNLTPCVYPMIPVTIAFFSAQAGLGSARPAGSLGRAVSLAAAYVLGISVNYALLGLLAAKTGALFGSWLQHPAVLVAVALILIALSLSLFGVYELRPPSAVMQRLGHAKAGIGGAFLMGLVVGLVAAPCIGPFVLGLLLAVSQLANPAAGFLLFFALGLGMGLPYLVLAVAADRIGRLPKAGAWLEWTKQGLGLALWAVAFYFVRPLLPDGVQGPAAAGLLLGGGAYVGWLARVPARAHPAWGRPSTSLGTALLSLSKGGRRAAGAGLLLAALVVGWPRLAAGPSVIWIPYSEAALAQARREGRPALIDVYADWCLPCVEMDHVTFHHPDVVAALAPMVTLRVDATREVPPEAQALFARHHVYGAPTVLLFDRRGEERADLRLLGFVDPAEFLERLGRLRESRIEPGG